MGKMKSEGMIRSIFDFDNECDITGNKLSVSILIKDQIFLSGEGIDYLINFIGSDKTSSNKNNCQISTKKSECDICDSWGENIKIRKKKHNSHFSFLCKDCLSYCKEKFNEIQDYVMYKSDKIKIVIKENEEFVHDVALNEEVKTDGCIIIRKRNSSNLSVVIALTNIFKFKKGLRSPSGCDFIFEEDIPHECDVCDSLSEDSIGFGFTHVCQSCRDDIWKDLDDFTDENKKFLVSREV